MLFTLPASSLCGSGEAPRPNPVGTYRPSEFRSTATPFWATPGVFFAGRGPRHGACLLSAIAASTGNSLITVTNTITAVRELAEANETSQLNIWLRFVADDHLRFQDGLTAWLACCCAQQKARVSRSQRACSERARAPAPTALVAPAECGLHASCICPCAIPRTNCACMGYTAVGCGLTAVRHAAHTAMAHDINSQMQFST